VRLSAGARSRLFNGLGPASDRLKAELQLVLVREPTSTGNGCGHFAARWSNRRRSQVGRDQFEQRIHRSRKLGRRGGADARGGAGKHRPAQGQSHASGSPDYRGRSSRSASGVTIPRFSARRCAGATVDGSGVATGMMGLSEEDPRWVDQRLLAIAAPGLFLHRDQGTGHVFGLNYSVWSGAEAIRLDRIIRYGVPRNPARIKKR
jgi:hypothetical protein